MESHTKTERAISVLLIANKYKYDPPKLAEFIEKNNSYFKKDTAFINLLKIGTPKTYVSDADHNEKVPVFKKL